MYKLSVAILTFNRKDKVVRAIESAFCDHTVKPEVIVVDNNSTDGTYEFLSEKYADNRDVKLIRLPRNMGCPDGRNFIYANCASEYIINLDDDGFLDKGALQKVIDVFEADLSIGIISMKLKDPAEKSIADGLEHFHRREVTNFSGGLSAFRKSMLKSTGMYPEDFFFFAEEEYLSLKAINEGYKILYCPDIIMWHPVIRGSVALERNAVDYYKFRNPLLVVIRLFPTFIMIKYLLLRIVSYTIISLKRGSFIKFLCALIYIFTNLPRLIILRKPCSVATVEKYFALRYLPEN